MKKLTFLLLLISSNHLVAQEFTALYSIDLKHNITTPSNNPDYCERINFLTSDREIVKIDSIYLALFTNSLENPEKNYFSSLGFRKQFLHAPQRKSIDYFLNDTTIEYLNDLKTGEMYKTKSVTSYTEKDVVVFSQHMNFLFNESTNNLEAQTYSYGFSVNCFDEFGTFKGSRDLFYSYQNPLVKKYFQNPKKYYGLTDQEILQPNYTWIRNIELPAHTSNQLDSLIKPSLDCDYQYNQVKQIKGESLPELLYQKFLDRTITGYDTNNTIIDQAIVSEYGSTSEEVYVQVDESGGFTKTIIENKFTVNALNANRFDIKMTTKLKNGKLENKINQVTLYRFVYNDYSTDIKPFMIFNF